VSTIYARQHEAYSWNSSLPGPMIPTRPQLNYDIGDTPDHRAIFIFAGPAGEDARAPPGEPGPFIVVFRRMAVGLGRAGRRKEKMM
jgi:hypothetical protein